MTNNMGTRDEKKSADLKKRLEDLDHSETVVNEMNKKAGKPDLSKLNQKNKAINIVSEGLVSELRIVDHGRTHVNRAESYSAREH